MPTAVNTVRQLSETLVAALLLSKFAPSGKSNCSLFTLPACQKDHAAQKRHAASNCKNAKNGPPGRRFARMPRNPAAISGRLLN
jgi:hypothetical protein